MILLIGYLASALLAMSLIVSNAIKFRWLNLFGCLAFICYGLMIDAFPVIIANTILFCINVYQTIKLYTVKEVFEMVEITEENEFVSKFLNFYNSDIGLFFPDFDIKKMKHEKYIAFAVLRNLSIANIFFATINEEGNAIVKINYTVPKYRDYKVGRFIFERENEYLQQHSITQIIYQKVHNKNHLKFIKIMGFKIRGGDVSMDGFAGNVLVGRICQGIAFSCNPQWRWRISHAIRVKCSRRRRPLLL